MTFGVDDVDVAREATRDSWEDGLQASDGRWYVTHKRTPNDGGVYGIAVELGSLSVSSESQSPGRDGRVAGERWSPRLQQGVAQKSPPPATADTIAL